MVKLEPTADQFAALESTLVSCNEVANEVAGLAQSMRLRSRRALQVALYPKVKTRGLSAQPTLHVLRKVADAYTTRQANLTNGNYGRPGSTRYTAVAGTAVAFRPRAAQPFDDRCLSWQMDVSTVSIWTTAGRMRGVRFVCAPWQHTLLADRKGETDLVYRDGHFYLHATVDEPSPEPAPPPDTAEGWLGVDLGIVNLAVTTDDDPATLDVRWSAGAVTARRKKYATLRATLQRVGTKSVKRKLKARRRKEQRFATDINHQLSKTIVAKAQRTGRGIAVEDLSGIRDRVRLARGQRTQLHAWGYAQLRAQITYKAGLVLQIEGQPEMAGVPVAVVDPRNTSRTCSHCGYCDKANRVSQATFRCRHCQWAGHADHNAARNIAALGHRAYRAAQSTAPIAATPPAASGNVSSKPGPFRAE
ncbi:transposase [Rhodococcus opacus M213]|uniref:Transposase n=1 Tax=Rhodococcus opacus M213 TaxID=1129896 RepID=K8XS56_RHOOP|nr:transposase [Rhodococcus opacus M213]